MKKMPKEYSVQRSVPKPLSTNHYPLTTRATKGSEFQQGFVAIISCLLMTGIILVITITFVRVMQREQRQSLDRQLSTQAFYAAESGANYAIKKDIFNRTNCNDPADPPGFGIVGPSISFTCLLVNDAPDSLVFDNVNTEKPVVFNITSQVDQLDFHWQGPTGNEDWCKPSLGCNHPTFYPSNDPGDGTPFWGNKIGVVEVIIYPIKASVSVSDLQSSSRTYYLYPSVGPQTVNYSVDGEVVNGHCDNGFSPKDCRVTIAGLNIAGVTGYVLRLRSIYNPVSLVINGKVAGAPVALTGAQRVIDVTGKASDVLRRLQIRLPLKSGFDLPIFAIETGEDLCKLQGLSPGAGTDDCP